MSALLQNEEDEEIYSDGFISVHSLLGTTWNVIVVFYPFRYSYSMFASSVFFHIYLVIFFSDSFWGMAVVVAIDQQLLGVRKIMMFTKL